MSFSELYSIHPSIYFHSMEKSSVNNIQNIPFLFHERKLYGFGTTQGWINHAVGKNSTSSTLFVPVKVTHSVLGSVDRYLKGWKGDGSWQCLIAFSSSKTTTSGNYKSYGNIYLYVSCNFFKLMYERLQNTKY